MAKEITKIVLTGGPCAGKTKGLNTVESELTQIGYGVLILPEVATEFFTGGVSVGENGLSVVDFQTAIMKYQREREEIYEEIAYLLPQEKVVLLCDRGALDAKAYCTQEEFNQILDRVNLNEVVLRDEYDAVFHLVTAAKGAEKYYTLENNPARKESSLDDARDADSKTMNAWTGHPHLRILDNSVDFNTKINWLVAEIFRFLGEPVPIEIEKKFLIKMPDINFLMEKFHAEKLDIIQTYLKTDNSGEEKRIRQRGNNGDYVYFLTTKMKMGDDKMSSRIEIEKRITYKEYLKQMMSVDTDLRQIRKTRYCFVYQNLYFELDVYPFWNEKAVLEIELTEENQEVTLPPFIKVIKDVTEDDSYKNHSIAKNIPA